jgi:hypothetical protein
LKNWRDDGGRIMGRINDDMCVDAGTVLAGWDAVTEKIVPGCKRELNSGLKQDIWVSPELKISSLFWKRKRGKI